MLNDDQFFHAICFILQASFLIWLVATMAKRLGVYVVDVASEIWDRIARSKS